MTSTDPAASPPTDHAGEVGRAIRRAMANAGWLLGGKGVGALLSLAYLAIIARTLGPTGFGIFATILAYTQAIENLAGFQSWQTVIHFGVHHIAGGRPERLARLIGFATLLDCAAAVVGAALAAGGAILLGTMLGWTPAERTLAAWFSLSLIVGQCGTPTGVLRLFDRFDAASRAEVTLPLMRLAGAAAVWQIGGGIGSYLVAWGVAEIAATAALWLAALRLMRRQRVPFPSFRIGGTRGENPGVVRFALTTNLSSSVGLLWQQAPVLAVGWLGGPAAAGGYRLAAQLGTSLAKPIVSFARSIYPEFARMAAKGEIASLSGAIARIERTCGLLGLAGLALMAAAGRPLLHLVGGPGYDFAYPTLLLLTAASAVNLCGFGLEPALVALGHPARALFARAAGGLIFMLLAFALGTALGATGVASAAIAASLASMLLLRVGFARTVRHLARTSGSGATGAD